MKKNTKSKKNRRALAVKKGKRSIRAKKVIAEKHIRREQFDKEKSFLKFKEEKALNQIMDAIQKGRDTNTQSF